MDDKKKRLTELDNDEEFLSQLEKARSRDDIIAVFKDFGVNLNRDELDMYMYAALNEGEIDEDDLKDISGGHPGLYAPRISARVYGTVLHEARICDDGCRQI